MGEQEPDEGQEQPPSSGIVGAFISRANAERAVPPLVTDLEQPDELYFWVDQWHVRQAKERHERREAYVPPEQPERERWAYIEEASALGYAVTRLPEGWVFLWKDHRDEEHDFDAIFSPSVPLKVHPYSGLSVIQVWIGDDSEGERYDRTYQRVLDQLDKTGQGGYSTRDLAAWQDLVDRQLEIREQRVGGLLRDLASVLKVYITEAATHEQAQRPQRWHHRLIDSIDVHTIFEFEIVGAIRSDDKVYKAGDEEAYLATNPRGIDLLRLVEKGVIANPPRGRLPEGEDHGWLLFLDRLHRSARSLWWGLSTGSVSDRCYDDVEGFFDAFPTHLLVEESTRAGVHHYGEALRAVLLEVQRLLDKRWALHTIAEALLLDKPVPEAAAAAASRVEEESSEGPAQRGRPEYYSSELTRRWFDELKGQPEAIGHGGLAWLIREIEDRHQKDKGGDPQERPGDRTIRDQLSKLGLV